MTAQALPNTQELVDKINFFVEKSRKPSEGDIAGLKQDAGKLKNKISYPDYCDYLGQISCLENDKVNMLGHYKNALVNSFNKNLEIKKNYFISLYRCGLILEASEQLKEITKNSPTSTETLSFLSGKKFDLCRFKESLKSLNKLKDKPDFFGTVKKAVSIFENAGLSDDDAQHLCELAYSVLETRKLYFSGSEIEIIDDCVFYTIYVDSPIEDIAEINWKLAETFAELDDMRSDILLFEYSSVAVLEEKQKQ